MKREHKNDYYVLKQNEQIAKNTYKAVFEGDTSAIFAPGQFVNIKIDGLFLRRPISICDYNDGEITLVYKVVGKGTAVLSQTKPGAVFDIICGLGNGYTLRGEKPLLIGGGVGVPPLYGLAKKLAKKGKTASVIMGFGSADEIFFKDEFESMGHSVRITTVDGSYGIKGFVTDAFDVLEYDYFYTCGPEPMLKAVCAKTVTEGQISFEERMGCGFGACMGCSCKTITGSKRICREGPVLLKSELAWTK